MTIIEFNNSHDDLNKNVGMIERCLGSKAVILVWAVWCPHCTSMKDDWNYLKNNTRGINFIEIESGNLERIKETNRNLYRKLFPQSDRVFYPMIKTWNNSKGQVYQDERTLEAMKSHLEKKFKNTKKKTDKSKKESKKESKTKSTEKKLKVGGKTMKNTNDIQIFKDEFNNYIDNILKSLK